MPSKKLKKNQSKNKHVWQWYWCRDWLNRKCKAYYYGPRSKWMKLYKRK